MAQSEFSEIEKKLDDKLSYLQQEIQKVRGGRANPELIEEISVDYYGSKQPVKSLGTISVLGAQALVIEPWDKNALEPIANAITKSQNGLQAVVDGDRVRIPFPPLSAERREELVRFVAKKTEEVKIQMRQIRDEEIKELKNQEGISEDEIFRSKKGIDELFKKYFEKIDKLKEAKEKELQTV